MFWPGRTPSRDFVAGTGGSGTGGSSGCTGPVPGTKATNPLIGSIFTADPAVLVHDCTFYITAGHDEGTTGFNLKDWYVLSSTDLVNWSYNGGPKMTLQTFSWANANAWAGQMIERDGKFYWYVPVNEKGGGMAIGFVPRAEGAQQTTGPSELTPWIVIGADDIVTVRVPGPEAGTGSSTQAAMYVTEELGCDWNDVRVEPISFNRNTREGNLYLGATGIWSTFAGAGASGDLMKTLTQAGASARERLRAAGAQGAVAASQALLLPEVVDLEEPACDRLEEKADELAALGLAIERFGPAAMLVRAVPTALGKSDVQALVRDVADDLAQNGDALLLGTDLAKSQRALQLAYDDPLQVTAAFNRNLLRRINDELGGTFDLEGFAHRALWNPQERRIEMHLVSTRAQRVHIRGVEVDFAAGESIWTESCHKYDCEQFAALADAAGLHVREVWMDDARRFSVQLLATG